MSQNSVELFSKNWSIYQKIIKHNYMFHRDLGAITSSVWDNHFQNKEANVLDLGCGDAYQLSTIMEGRQINSYTGIDLSSAVLEYTKDNLDNIKIPFSLMSGPMEFEIDKTEITYDLIYSSYAFHHLQEERKKDLLEKCYAKLNTDGVLILIDHFKNDGQDRDNYIDEYVDNIKTNWAEITSEENDLIEEHMRGYDFPTTSDQIDIWGKEIGFVLETQPHVNQWHKILTMKKQLNLIRHL